MIIRPARQSDWDLFAHHACAEGWRIPRAELALFRGPWAEHAQVLDDDRFCGLVTAVPHEKSGWIGNLIVPQALRGQGYGTLLFEHALNRLAERNLSSVWLTASAMGRPIYEKYGFAAVGTIERWAAGQRSASAAGAAVAADGGAQLRHSDRRAWGEDRSLLLEALAGMGRAFARNDSVAMLQQEPGLQIVGPWYSSTHCLHDNLALLQDILAQADPAGEVVIDLLASSAIRQLLVTKGFYCLGKTALMVRGAVSAPGLDELISLASLGSFG